jgi:hypothetical protein
MPSILIPKPNLNARMRAQTTTDASQTTIIKGLIDRVEQSR